MQRPRYLLLVLLAGLVIGTGCHSGKSARGKARYQSTENGFSDIAARSEYIDRRTRELTDKGVKPAEASARASREWFAQAPVTTAVATDYERERRKAEASITTYLEKEKDARSR